MKEIGPLIKRPIWPPRNANSTREPAPLLTGHLFPSDVAIRCEDKISKRYVTGARPDDISGSAQFDSVSLTSSQPIINKLEKYIPLLLPRPTNCISERFDRHCPQTSNFASCGESFCRRVHLGNDGK
ncbi:hypothetical protein BaRGS_00004039 [Batillaria attramentaria]|uniref:Uncharacterized protein n=1 Tax=Batillaria attramentaria TaxID=370345 RepID=A0ABD0LZI9_9CAEN